MKILIDTHIYLWALADRARLDERRLYELESRSNIIYVSSVTIAELMIKASIGKMTIDFDPVEMALESGFELLDYSAYDAKLLKNLPFYHRDPFDRMLVTQAMAGKMPLMTDDAKIRSYDCRMM